MFEVLYRVRPRKITILRAWCQYLMRMGYEDARASLIQENVLWEQMLLYHTNGSWFVLGRYEVVPRKQKVAADLNVPLNRRHRDVLDACLMRPPIPASVVEHLEPVKTLYEVVV